MNRGDIELLAAVDDEGSLTAAATRLHTAQPALSRRLARIEQESGVLLFERGRSGARATPAGRGVIDAARRALAGFDEVESAARRASSAQIGTLRLGTTPTLGADLLPKTLATFRVAHPEVHLELHSSGDSTTLVEAVATGELDVAVAVLGGVRNAGLIANPRGRQSFSIVVTDDDPLAELDAVPRSLLQGRPVVALAHGEGLRLMLETLYAGLDVEPDIAIETTEREMLIPFVTAGLGFTVAPTTFATLRAGEGTAVLPLDPPLDREVGVLRRRSSSDNLVSAFVDLVELG